MRLRFSRTADYALRAALEIAAAPDGTLLTRRQVAAATRAPDSILAQVLAQLVRGGVLVARAGPKGGYRLGRPRSEVTVHDVVTAIDGGPTEQRCVLRDQVCSWTGACPFHAVMTRAQESFLATLRETTLADVIRSGSPDALGASGVDASR